MITTNYGKMQIKSGLMGSGKTLDEVGEGLAHMGNGGIWTTNIKLLVPGVRHYMRDMGWAWNPSQYIYIDQDQLINPHRFMPRCKSGISLLSLDECVLFLDSSADQEVKKAQKDFLIFLTMLRREHANVNLIIQDVSLMIKRVRILFQYRYNYNNLARCIDLPFLGAFPFELLTKAKYDKTDQYLGCEFKVANKKLYKCYETEQKIIKYERPEVDIKSKQHNKKAIYRLWKAKLKKCVIF